MISAIRIASAAHWDEAWNASPQATYFQSREWHELWERYSRGRMMPEPVEFVFADGRSCVFPCARWQPVRGLWRVTVATPGGNYGGLIASGCGMTIEHRQQAIQALLKLNRNLIWRANPIDTVGPDDVKNRRDIRVAQDTTHILSLSDGFDRVLRGWSKGHAAAARQGRSAGVTISLASTLEDWREYFEVYRRSLARWGNRASSRYDWPLFDHMRKLESRRIRLWLARHEGRIAAGALCLYSFRHVVYWHGAALAECFKVRPVHWMLHEAIRDACESGYEWFDFNPSGGHSGVAAFKKSFGAVEVSAPVIYRSTPSFRLYRSSATWLCKLTRSGASR